MTEKELESLFYTRQRIQSLRQMIDDFCFIRSVPFGGGGGAGPGDPTATAAMSLAALEDKWEETLQNLTRQAEEITAYIEAVDEADARTIMTMRYLDNNQGKRYTWEEIGERIGYDRTTCSKIVHRYIQTH